MVPHAESLAFLRFPRTQCFWFLELPIMGIGTSRSDKHLGSKETLASAELSEAPPPVMTNSLDTVFGHLALLGCWRPMSRAYAGMGHSFVESAAFAGD